VGGHVGGVPEGRLREVVWHASGHGEREEGGADVPEGMERAMRVM